MALQEVGEVTCTLGEIRNRADLVIFWGCNPAQSHPRHAERYSVTTPGQLVAGGRSDRTVVMIGSEDEVGRWQIDSAGTQPDLRIPVQPGRDFEWISLLRGRLQQDASDDVTKDADRKLGQLSLQSMRQAQQLISMIRQCRYGVIFFGLGLAGSSNWAESKRSDVGHINVAALLQLVAELNAVTRFTARRMRLQGDVSGADNVLCWQTGYPFAVDFSRGYPRYNPGEFSANQLLERKEVDVCLLIGAETIPYFSESAIEYLRTIPVVLLDYPNASLPWTPEIRFTTAVYGLHAAGTAYRMDNVPIALKAMVPSQLPTDEEILERLRQHCSEIMPQT
jgi:formylmethanofuran dehydrogenase subunit B